MFKNALKNLLIISLLSFGFSASGLMMLLHVFSIEHHEKHDSEHCTICKQLLLAPEKFCIESNPENHSEYSFNYIEFHIEQYISIFNPLSKFPRAPPFI